MRAKLHTSTHDLSWGSDDDHVRMDTTDRRWIKRQCMCTCSLCKAACMMMEINIPTVLVTRQDKSSCLVQTNTLCMRAILECSCSLLSCVCNSAYAVVAVQWYAYANDDQLVWRAQVDPWSKSDTLVTLQAFKCFLNTAKQTAVCTVST